MNALVAYSINDQNFIISPERVLFWEKQKTLILSDIHAGKTGHFRKAGIPVPQGAFREDLQRLFSQILFFKAEQLIIAGDLTHSHSNRELDLFARWRSSLGSLSIQLVKGNHDILQDNWYKETNITVHKDELTIDEFSFCHDLHSYSGAAPGRLYCFSGHLHPGIALNGRGRQVLQFPCFYFAHQHCILPAFSKFTGTALIKPDKGEHVFAIVENQLVQVQ